MKRGREGEEEKDMIRRWREEMREDYDKEMKRGL
jgi:hypothetical protein